MVKKHFKNTLRWWSFLNLFKALDSTLNANEQKQKQQNFILKGEDNVFCLTTIKKH